MRTTSCLLLATLVTAPLASQAAEPEQADWRLPFRNPSQKLDPPENMYRELQVMLARSRASGVEPYFNKDGIEVCDDNTWREAHRRLLALERQDAGYLSQVIRLSGSVEDREIALYGMYYNRDLSLVMQLINHIPGEPVRRLREDGYLRAARFLSAQLPKKNAGSLEEWKKIRVGPGGTMPPKPGEFTFEFDEFPFFMLLNTDSPIDQRQALWFLGEVVKARPSTWKDYLAAASPVLYPLALHDDAGVRQSTRDFIALLDPDGEKRKAPGDDAPDSEINAWLDAIMYDIFPPIRHISPGLVDLYPSDDLKAIMATGTRLLQDGSLGDPTSGKTKGKTPTYYRGLRIARMPEPLDMLGLKVDWVVTAINGRPVASCAEILNVLKAEKWRRSFMVEYIADGKQHAKEFRRAN